MIHYICTGDCKGVSEEPKKCGDKSCILFDEPLTECDCADGKHYQEQDAHTHEQ